jgi:hypothetical protein
MSDITVRPLRPYQFQPGNPGRPPSPLGHVRMREALKALNFDPVAECVARFRDPLTPNASKDACLGMILDRFLPKLRSTESHTTTDSRQQVLIEIAAGLATPPAIVLDAQFNENSDLEPVKESIPITKP